MRLDRNRFEKWLKAMPPEFVVGRQRDCHSCPVARFYRDVTRGHEIVVSDNGGGYIIDRGYDKRPAPGWAEAFFFAVDGEAGRDITAGRALEILAKIERPRVNRIRDRYDDAYVVPASATHGPR